MDVSTNSEPDVQLAVADLPGLINLIQIGTLEIHTWGSRRQHLEKPYRLVFDLDPGSEFPWQQVVRAAKDVRLILGELGLVSFLKTSSGKGLHIVVPIQQRTTCDEVKVFCRDVAVSMAKAAPDRHVATMSKAERKQKIFIDYLRNDAVRQPSRLIQPERGPEPR